MNIPNYGYWKVSIDMMERIRLIEPIDIELDLPVGAEPSAPARIHKAEFESKALHLPDNRVTFRWTPVPGALRYYISIHPFQERFYYNPGSQVGFGPYAECAVAEKICSEPIASFSLPRKTLISLRLVTVDSPLGSLQVDPLDKDIPFLFLTGP